MGGIDSRKMAGLMNRKNAADQASKGEGTGSRIKADHLYFEQFIPSIFLFRLHQKAIEYGDEDQKSILARINSDMESELAICESNKTKLKISKSQFAGIITGVNALINDLGLDFKVNHTWELLDGLAHIEASINTLKAAKVSQTFFANSNPH